jgi:peptidoglycan hydrolase CwlO-like protein
MKKIIVATVSVFSILTSSMVANPVIIAELAKMESSLTGKDNQIAALQAELESAKAEIESAKAEVARLKESPDFDQAVKAKFNSLLADTKTKLQTLTEEIISKIKKGETK